MKNTKTDPAKSVETLENRSNTALREALEEQLRYWNAHIRTRDEEEMRKRTEAALSLPPRNCDVGTADEQADRFKAFCYANRTPDNECSKECRFNDTSAICYCQARWAQMPYEGKESPND